MLIEVCEVRPGGGGLLVAMTDSSWLWWCFELLS